ncbi:jg14904, partial [Pararge aegeria aegeria]
MSLKLVTDVHTEINKTFPTNSYFVCGTYEYYHYLCDGFDDRGWGCGYRTLQTICSWMMHNNYNNSQNVPSITEIQKILVELEDKPESFLGSKQWIGSFEVCLTLDKLYNVSSKIIHVNRGDDLENIVDNLCTHFEKFGSPVMMGGDLDCSSKGVVGVHVDGVNSQLLIV